MQYRTLARHGKALKPVWIDPFRPSRKRIFEGRSHHVGSHPHRFRREMGVAGGMNRTWFAGGSNS